MKTFVTNNSQDHDLSITYINGSTLSHYLTERFDRVKHSGHYQTMLKIVGHISGGDSAYNIDFDVTTEDYRNHHLHHAFCGLLGSTFEDAIIFVLDGAGSSFENSETVEVETVIFLDRNKTHEVLYKRLYRLEDPGFSSVGIEYERYCLNYGFNIYDAGKIMGIAQYKGNEHLINNPAIRSLVDTAHILQQTCTAHAIDVIKTFYDSSKSKNVIITGGYALNCVSNKKYLDFIPPENLYIDPICNDSGLALGKSYRKYDINPTIKHTYLGWKEQTINFNGRNAEDADYNDVARLIAQGQAIALFQGAAETGRRSLGNRSLLFDPRYPGAKDSLNLIKQREAYRPFACSILEENAHELFDLKGMSSSPFMCYALDALPKALELLPGAIHADGTSRIQTVNAAQNKHFYNLIKAFEAQTGVPGIINTSFNLGGEPLVERVSDAWNALENSDIHGVYFPEYGKLVRNPNF